MNGMSRRCETIFRACDHVSGKTDHCLRVGREQLYACLACANAAGQAWREDRKAQLAARPRDCDRCGLRPHTWTVAGYRLCGRCKTTTMREHHRESAKHGLLAIFATEPLVDTRQWAARARQETPQ